MKLTEDSIKMMSFFVENKCLSVTRQTKQTNEIFTGLFYEIRSGVSYVQKLKKKMGDSFYNLKIDSITNIKQIPKPSTFPPNSFPSKIRKHIDEHSLTVFTYSFHTLSRNITIIFLTEQCEDIEQIISVYNNYVDFMLVWLYIVDSYASKSCAPDLKVFVYHTSLLKVLPQTNIEVLGEEHVNTAFTRTCPKKSEIIIFRKEEWFKVFIHETFHNFGLDFSDINITRANNRILAIFPVHSEVNLFECYTEFWARIMNVLFCSYNSINDKNNIEEFLKNASMLIKIERAYAGFQMVKVLHFMDMNYSDLYSNTISSQHIRESLYKEETSVLSYYVLTNILLNNYQQFLLWCDENNTSLLQFKKTNTNLDHFCTFIESHYKTKKMTNDIRCFEQLFKMVKTSNAKKDTKYLLSNLRMTICELG
jgi:hypothetical protein